MIKRKKQSPISVAEVGRRQFVYIVAGGPEHVKIGIAKDVYSRLNGIQTGCPFKATMYRFWRTPHARKIEKHAHHVLANYRTAGEWFKVPATAAGLVVEGLINGTNHIKSVAFCRNCFHSAAMQFIPKKSAILRCSNCRHSERAHLIMVR